MSPKLWSFYILAFYLLSELIIKKFLFKDHTYEFNKDWLIIHIICILQIAYGIIPLCSKITDLNYRSFIIFSNIAGIVMPFIKAYLIKQKLK